MNGTTTRRGDRSSFGKMVQSQVEAVPSTQEIRILTWLDTVQE